VRALYARPMCDPIIGGIFVDIAQLDLEGHVPRVTSLWETILHSAGPYGGGPSRRTPITRVADPKPVISSMGVAVEDHGG
jgi:hypothetical protein